MCMTAVIVHVPTSPSSMPPSDLLGGEFNESVVCVVGMIDVMLVEVWLGEVGRGLGGERGGSDGVSGITGI